MLKLDFILGKSVGVVGLGRTGQAAVIAIEPYAAKVIWFDDKLQECQGINAPFVDLADIQWQKLDIIVLSPGLPTTHPKPHAAYALAKRHNIPIYSDIDLLYRAQSDKKFISITGTNGKSTAVSLLHHLLRSNGQNYELGGNIGVPVLTFEGNSDGYVLELSSFQLEISPQIHSHISAILNITPDHLDRHGSIEEYVSAKCKIYQNSTKDDYVILNIDNEITHKIYSELLIQDKVQLVPFSTHKIADGVFTVFKGQIHDNALTHQIYDYEASKSLQGAHNAENIAVSLIAAQLSGCNIASTLHYLDTFQALPYRMQYLGGNGSIEFYNDSKATNSESVAQVLRTFDNIYWIAGGVAKEGGISSLIPLFSHIKHGFFFGEARKTFSVTAKENNLSSTSSETMKEALDAAINIAQHDSDKAVIVLSPACSSFDQFKDFMQRGQLFTQYVNEYLKC